MTGAPQIEIAVLGWADSLILMVLALVVFGPRRLPQIGRQIGRLMYEFRKASNDFKFQMEEELRAAEEADRRKADEERRKLDEERRKLDEDRRQLEEDRHKALLLEAPQSAPSGDESSASEEIVHPIGVDALEAAPEPAVPEHEPDPSVPQIQPPSIGEQVPAARPNGAVSSSANGRGNTSEAHIGHGVPSGVSDTAQETEQAARHG